MEWEAPAVVLDARPYGEGDAIATVLTEAQGLYRGLARGGAARGRAAIWLPGNLVQARWVARLADQLGSLTGELAHPAAALVMDDPLALAILSAATAVAAGALPEHAPHPGVFAGLVRLIAGLAGRAANVADLVRWEMELLAALGYGLDLSSCAVTGTPDDLAFVSPRSGRAVSRGAAGVWADRLLPLPVFLLDQEQDGKPAEWRDGLRLTAHFLARDAFGQVHKPLPPARVMLYERVAALAAEGIADA
jgi:DNA repair protein RecO (recombination protein O)